MSVPETRHFIGGAFVASVSGRRFDKRSPVDGRLLTRVHEAGAAEVDAAVAAARAALPGPWGCIAVADTGKPVSPATHIDIPRGAANFKVFADTLKTAGTEFFEMPTPDGQGLLGNHALAREEIFGPCCHGAPFDTEDEAMTLANDTACGLAAVVHTAHLARAHRVSARRDVGVCWVNSWFLRDLRTPFSGAGQSGVCREGGLHSLAFYTDTRNVCVKL